MTFKKKVKRDILRSVCESSEGYNILVAVMMSFELFTFFAAFTLQGKLVCCFIKIHKRADLKHLKIIALTS